MADRRGYNNVQQYNWCNLETRLAVFIKGLTIYLVAKPENEDHVSYFADSHLAQKRTAQNFPKSKGLPRGENLGIFPSLGAFILGKSYIPRLASRFSRCFASLDPRAYIRSIFPSPRGYVAGQSVCRRKTRNISRFQNLQSRKAQNFSESQSLYSREYSFIFSAYFPS